MKNPKTLRRLFVLTSIVVVSSVLAAGIYTQSSTPQKKQRDHERTYEATKLTIAPQVISIVKGVDRERQLD